MPQGWKDRDYEEIPIVQEACPSDHHVAAYVQGVSDIPTFRVAWITSMGIMRRTPKVSPNKFGDARLWKTPDQDAEFWEPCKQGDSYRTLTPGDDDCCRMCPNTDAEELIPCAWCSSWAHYRCTYAVGPGRACASHFKVVNPLDKIVVARSDDGVVPESQRDKQVFPNCCHPRVREHGTPSPSNVHYTAEAIWVYKHAWRGAGAYYRKGDHLQKKKTGNTPVEFKALRMFPEWERWIVPKPTFLSDSLLKEAATLEEKGEPKNRVQRHNIFEHYKEEFQPHTLTLLPGMNQTFKEYGERANLDPNLGNLWGCFWESCNIKERGFWQAALGHHANYSLTDDSRVYHAITFGEDHPGYKPANDEMPSDKPENNDQRFCYYTEVRRWNECQVKEERTLRVASDKVQSWLDIGDTILDETAVFPQSQEEANQATAASKKAAKGAKKRPSSVPPGSDTAKAKQAKAQADAKEKKPVVEKVRIPTIPKQELAAIATTLTNKVKSAVPSLNPKHYRTIHNLASEWYKALYHTKFQMTKADYLHHLHKTAEGYQKAKETNPTHLGAFNKALMF